MYNMKNYFSYDTPAGEVFILAEGADILRIDFSMKEQFAGAERRETPVIMEAGRQLGEYFEGRRKRFDLPLRPVGTPFQMKVWAVLATIPYGATWSYGQVAGASGSPKAARAVGMANNRNPISIVVPCHRVIGSDGKLVGYGGGLDKKSILLELESRNK